VVEDEYTIAFADEDADDDDIFIDLNYIVYHNDSKSVSNIIYRQ